MRFKQVENQAQVSRLVLGVDGRVLANELEICQLEQWIGIWNGIELFVQVLQRLIMIDGHESQKSVALACRFVLLFQKRCEQLGRVWKQLLMALVDRHDGEHGVLLNIGMPVT